MKVKALKTLGGVINAQAGEEFELANEAVLHDLLNQGVVTPVESNPQEVAKNLNINGEQLADARQQYATEKKLQDDALSEAVQYVNNQKVTQEEEQKKQQVKQARQQADQVAQEQFQAEENLRQANAQVEQMRQQVKQEQAVKEATARSQATQRNTQSHQQSSTNRPE